MEEQQKSPIGRRAVAKGIAWSVPAFALATAAPALAASPAIIITEGDVCKYAGNSGPTGTFQSYLFPVTIQNVSNEEVCITATGARVILTDGTTKGGNPVFWNAAPGSPGAAPGGTTVCIGIGSTVTYWLVMTETGDSSNSAGTAYVDVLVAGQLTGRQYTDQASTSFGATPPSCAKKNDATTTTQSAELKSAPQEVEDTASEPEPAPAEDTAAESSESTAAEEPAASDGGGAEPAPSDGGR